MPREKKEYEIVKQKRRANEIKWNKWAHLLFIMQVPFARSLSVLWWNTSKRKKNADEESRRIEIEEKYSPNEKNEKRKKNRQQRKETSAKQKHKEKHTANGKKMNHDAMRREMRTPTTMENTEIYSYIIYIALFHIK